MCVDLQPDLLLFWYSSDSVQQGSELQVQLSIGFGRKLKPELRGCKQWAKCVAFFEMEVRFWVMMSGHFSLVWHKENKVTVVKKESKMGPLCRKTFIMMGKKHLRALEAAV